MPLFNHFDLVAPIYDRLARQPDPQVWLEPAALPTSGALLDAGGGTGRFAAALKPFVGRAVVADLSFGMVSQVAGKDGLEPVNACSEALPFASSSFERIVMVDALHHVIDQVATANELWRLLSPGGRLVIAEPDKETWAVKLVILFEKVTLMRSHLLSINQIAALFNQTGASVETRRHGMNGWVIVQKSATGKGTED